MKVKTDLKAGQAAVACVNDPDYGVICCDSDGVCADEYGNVAVCDDSGCVLL